MSNDSQNRFAVNRLVQDYLAYFEARGHTVVPSAPLLPEDPTLLFTAAGMVPFKAYYSRPQSAPYPRAASVQKCLRAGGKQSDLENVGRTLRHHTFFEMLGNFSFGDYFKKEAIEWAWELSVDVWQLDKSRIWVTIYDDDDEAHDLWAKHIGFPAERIKRLGKKDNFWGPVGDTGVCGPSSELHIDTGREGPDGGPGQDDSDRYIEYWNLVFPQFFYTEKGEYDPLPRPGIDTGMGLERLAFLLQGAEDNFHTDEFLPIRNAIAAALPKDADAGKAALAVNAAADHVRALTFALAEGIMPSNEGRGYVLRRLLRRALTKMQPFGVREPFLAAGVDAVVTAMGTRYPELRNQAATVKSMITAEETRFLDTLEQGMGRLETLFDDARQKKRTTIAGADVFQLYDTFGFPPELTREMAQDRGLDADMAGFEKAMEEQKERARRSGKFVQGAEQVSVVASGTLIVGRDLRADVKKTEFLGYDELACDASVVSVGNPRPERVAKQGAGTFLEVTTDRTVFYPEGGGQVGDAGSAAFGSAPLKVVDTYRAGDRIAHLVRVPDEIAARAVDMVAEHPDASLKVDRERRYATMRNHTATHLLHAALRSVLGEHVTQAGSLVAPDRLRFDFHHFQAVTPEEVARIERIVNGAVLENFGVKASLVPYKVAIASGAMALFGEKYGETVRVVAIDEFSRELCGGTHLRRTGEIGAFFIRQESAVASGVRRVEAVTGSGALALARAALDDWNQVASLLRVTPADVERRVRALIEENEAMAQRQKREEARRAQSEAADALAGAVDIGGVQYVALQVDVPDLNALRSYGDALRGRIGVGVGLVCPQASDKPVCLVVVSDSAIKERGLRADELTRKVAAELGYRGGGKPHLAQFGIPDTREFGRVRDFLRGVLATA
ncbi:MAG TPA: alanine--tRNA ligase [Candidatus Krumholzibacteria bacterium]|nr:alanine--tRNA ligase [Candidatus Krumholzibacteria bacterium]